jgi:hypothetical protein
MLSIRLLRNDSSARSSFSNVCTSTQVRGVVAIVSGRTFEGSGPSIKEQIRNAQARCSPRTTDVLVCCKLLPIGTLDAENGGRISLSGKRGSDIFGESKHVVLTVPCSMLDDEF